ncbi:MAG: hypothetical protein H0T46_02020 [Deltaproteobacteria bacterium]|nr:hypothetical protein [Deltaproteobacteria bacterium]
MWPHLARALLATSLGGCSLLYNPSNLPPQADAAPDAEMLVDADPSMLDVTDLKPSVLVEGAGANGSRVAVLVIDGSHMVAEGAMVMITPAAGAPKVPMLMVDNSKIVVEGNGKRLAVPVTLPVDMGLAAGDMIAMDVTVVQTSGGSMLTKKLGGKLQIKGLGELDTMGAVSLTGSTEYSFVNIRAGATLTVPGGQMNPIIIRSTSSLTIAPSISINLSGSGMTPGPAGGAGGTAGPGGIVGGSQGGEGGGPAKGLPSGGGGGFNAPEQLTSIDGMTSGGPNRSSGGAGGDGMSLGAAGGAGGAGGGSIALIADGNLVAGAVTAKGAAGTMPGGNPGGGGSGGVVYARAGGTLTLGAVDVTGTGNGAAGRARYDAGSTATVASAGSMFRGPAFVDPPAIVKSERPMLSVVGTPLKPFQFYWTNDTGLEIQGPYMQTFPASGTTMLAFPTTPGLFRGLNTLCVLAAGADATSNTKTCVDVAYLFAP